MNKNIKQLTDEYVKAEKILLEELSKLERSGNECNCEEPETVKVVFEGGYDEISEYCLNCGGMIISIR